MTAYRMRFIYQNGREVYPWEIITPDDNGIIEIYPGNESPTIQIKAFDDPCEMVQRMSYIRFGERDSDVYVYLHVGGGIECCDCGMLDRCFRVGDAQAMAQHLRDHIRHGQTVPAGVIDAVLDNPELDPFKDRPNDPSPFTPQPGTHLPPAL